MYHFSRSIYRELAPRVSEGPGVCESEAQQRILDACESTMQRLATDRRYFAKPAKRLFGEVRTLFPIGEQLHVYRVVERNVRLAIDYLETAPAEDLMLDGERECRAHTRKGTPCRREPLPGRDYCPSHKHLEENLDLGDGEPDVSTAAGAPPLGIAA
jgi:hypothetical protein